MLVNRIDAFLQAHAGYDRINMLGIHHFAYDAVRTTIIESAHMISHHRLKRRIDTR